MRPALSPDPVSKKPNNQKPTHMKNNNKTKTAKSNQTAERPKKWSPVGQTQRSDLSEHIATQIVSFRKDLYLGGDTCDLRELSDKAWPVHQASGEEKAPINGFVFGRRG